MKVGGPLCVRCERGRNPCKSSVQAEVATAAPMHALQRRHPPRAGGRGKGWGRCEWAGRQERRASVHQTPGFVTPTRELLQAGPIRRGGLRRSAGRLRPNGYI